jgi:type IV pilus assembly protein PilW
MKNSLENEQDGFTLVELLITMLISGIVISAIYSAFQSQQDSYLAQDQVTEMQQNIRAGLEIMTREIRMAGYDPTGQADATIETASIATIRFTMDLNDNEDVTDSGEDISYYLYTVGGIKKLGRRMGIGPPLPSPQPVAENIEELEFVYLDSDNNVTADEEKVRSVVISILARAGRPDKNFDNSKQYFSFSGTPWGPYDDNLRRRLLTQTVNCRNMGL